MREKRLAEIERLAGVDVETLFPVSTLQANAPGTLQPTAATATTVEIARHD
jgi:hypothetical protein